jgi:hypothetical protein
VLAYVIERRRLDNIGIVSWSAIVTSGPSERRTAVRLMHLEHRGRSFHSERCRVHTSSLTFAWILKVPVPSAAPVSSIRCMAPRRRRSGRAGGDTRRMVETRYSDVWRDRPGTAAKREVAQVASE